MFEVGRTVAHWFYQNAVWVFITWIIAALVLDVLLRSLAERRERLHPDDVSSVLSGIAFIGFKSLCSKLVLFSMSVWVYENLALAHLPLKETYVWVGVFVVRDFVYYWVHRAEHVTRVMWASHMVHHSPRTINYWTALRTPWMEELYKPFIALWMPLVGFHPGAVIAMDVVIALYGQSVHSETREFPRKMQRVMVTPSMHRVHHGSNPEYLDCNFGAMLSVWDRWFGTYREETVAPVYGLAGGQSVRTTRVLLAGGYPSLWAGMNSQSGVRAKLQYAMSAPGTPDTLATA